MGLVTLENSQIRLVVSTLGAEMQSLKILPKSQEVLWQGAAPVWPRRAPWLFPIVGKLFDDQYTVDGKTYTLKQHGFARDSEFTVISQSSHSACFSLKASPPTLAVYPFEFALEIEYLLQENALFVKIRVQNLGAQPLPFSFGAHPGFVSSPKGVVQTEEIEKQFWQFGDGQTPTLNLPVECKSKNVILKKDLQDQQAVVFKNSQSKFLDYLHPEFRLHLKFAEWPHFAIWSKNQDCFICLEPWCGLPQILEGRQGPQSPAFEYQVTQDWQRQLEFHFLPAQNP